VILGLKDKRAKALFEQRNPGKGFPSDAIRVARRKLIMLASAGHLSDLLSPPSNHLKALKGDRTGQHSIRINDRLRIVRTGSDAEQVEITDITEERGMTNNPLAPLHPGEVLREEYLTPLGITPYGLAAALHVPRTRIERLVREETPVTVDTALRLGRYFGTSPEFWLRIQAQFDIETAQSELDDDIASIVPLRKRA
jgi:addiction module HigA family antidote